MDKKSSIPLTLKGKPNFTELTHRVVHDSPDPLSFNEIFQRIWAITPIATKNPKGTIRNAVSQSVLVVPTGDGRYGWKLRVINGSVFRLTLSAADLKGEAVEIGEELRDALWPTFFGGQQRSDRSPVHLRLPDGVTTQAPLDFLGKAHWGTRASPEFWAWLKKQNAGVGDHLLIRVLDGEAKRYGVEFQYHSARDEAVIAERNTSIVQAASEYVRKKYSGAAIWEICTHLICTGHYRRPVPPDPLAEIWTRDKWEPILEAKGFVAGGWTLIDPHHTDDLIKELFGKNTAVIEAVNLPSLPREYQPGAARHPRPSPQARRGPVKTFTLRVNHRAWPDVWRDIEIAEDQTLEDLHLMIQQAFEWDDDHLYSFFMSGKAYDARSEIGSPWSETVRHTHQVTLGELELNPRRKFLYFFDYGDSHEFDVRVVKVNPAAAKGNYPRVVGKTGKAPEQYPDYEE
jgi:hypothetical protein